jgi:hypothetical protein
VNSPQVRPEVVVDVSKLSRFMTFAIVLSCLLSIPRPAFADSWSSAAPKAVTSQNGNFLVRMTPGTSIGDTFGFAGSPKGKFASAQWFRYRDDRYELYQTKQLLNPVAPINLAVTNDGTLVTLDNWHNVGYGEAVVVYAPDGTIRKKYKLADLYQKAKMEKFIHSVSSIWWRCVGADPSVDRDNILQVDDTLGGRFSFRLESGDYAYESGKGQCKGR